MINATVAGSITAARETHTRTRAQRHNTDDDDDDDDDDEENDATRGFARRIVARVERIFLCSVLYSVLVDVRVS